MLHLVRKSRWLRVTLFTTVLIVVCSGLFVLTLWSLKAGHERLARVAVSSMVAVPILLMLYSGVRMVVWDLRGRCLNCGMDITQTPDYCPRCRKPRGKGSRWRRGRD